MSNKRGLGRGLSELLAGTQKQTGVPAPTFVTEQQQKGELRKLPVEWLQRGRYQPRNEIDPETLEELSESIKAQGIIQPIVVRHITDNQYEIIAGERRWRASQLAGLGEVPVLVKDVSDEAAIAMALIENIQRENLNPIEEANALQRLMDEFEMTQQEVADAVGKSRTTVTNILRLLMLNPDVKILLERGDLDMGHARALLSLPSAEQSDAGRQVVAKDLSVRETENLVRKLLNPVHKKQARSDVVDADVRLLQNDLSEKLGAKVGIQYNAKGKGKLIIHYNDLDELEGILAHIK